MSDEINAMMSEQPGDYLNLPSDEIVISSTFFDWQDVLKQKESLTLISQVEALVSVRKSGQNIQLVLEKIPEISARFAKVSEKLVQSQKEFNQVQAAFLKVTVDQQSLKQKKERLLMEIHEIMTGNFTAATATDLPKAFSSLSLSQPKMAELFLTAKNYKVTQINLDQDLLHRKLAYHQQRKDSLLPKIKDYQTYLTELNDAGTELVRVLKQAKSILEKDHSEAQVEPESQVASKKTAPTSSLPPSDEANSSPPSSHLAARSSDTEPHPNFSSSLTEDQAHFSKKLKLTQKDNAELENLLAGREYNLWRKKLESLEGRYTAQSELEGQEGEENRQAERADRSWEKGQSWPNPDLAWLAQEESDSEQIRASRTWNDDYLAQKPIPEKRSRKRRKDDDFEERLTEASLDDIQRFSNLKDFDSGPSVFDLEFEAWLKKRDDPEDTSPLTHFDPIVTED